MPRYLELPGDLLDRSRAYSDMMDAGWVWLHRDFAMVREPPITLAREAPDPDRLVRRLHREDGPAIRWRDGTALWFYHGVRVTQQIIESPQTLSVKQILQEPNAEVRRIAMERHGCAKLLQATKAQILDEDQDAHGLRTLFRLEIPHDEPLVMVRVRCVRKDGAINTYFLRVPPDTANCRQAVAWTFAKAPADYAPAAES